jgi:TolA-binding protein
VLRAKQGDPDGAAAAYQQAIDTGHPDHAPAAMLGLGLLRKEQGDPDGAAAAYQQAIDTGHPDVAFAARAALDWLRSA